MFMQRTRAYILVVMKYNEWKIHVILVIHLRIKGKHWEINCNNLTHMTNLSTWYIFQEIHTNCQIQHIWHVDEFIFHQVIQHHYIRRKYFLRSIFQLIPLLINFHYSLYISVSANAND